MKPVSAHVNAHAQYTYFKTSYVNNIPGYNMAIQISRLRILPVSPFAFLTRPINVKRKKDKNQNLCLPKRKRSQLLIFSQRGQRSITLVVKNLQKKDAYLAYMLRLADHTLPGSGAHCTLSTAQWVQYDLRRINGWPHACRHKACRHLFSKHNQ